MNFTENALSSIDNFEPAEGKVLVLPAKAADKTKAGIFIPDTAQERPQIGTLVCVGETDNKNARIGTTVIYGKYAGVPLDIQDENNNITSYFLMDVKELMGFFKTEIQEEKPVPAIIQDLQTVGQII